MKKRNGLKKFFRGLGLAIGAFVISLSALIVAPKLSDYIDELVEDEPTVEVTPEDDTNVDEIPEVEEDINTDAE